MVEDGRLRGRIVDEGALNGEMKVPEIFGPDDHCNLTGRDKPDQHPVEAITGLRSELDGKLAGGGFLTNLEIQAILDS